MARRHRLPFLLVDREEPRRAWFLVLALGLQERRARSGELRPVSLATSCVSSIIEYLLRMWLDKPGNKDMERGKRTGKDIGRGLRSATAPLELHGSRRKLGQRK